MVDIGLFHHRQELACVGRQRLYIAALSFGINGVECQRGFAGAGQAGNHDEPVPGQVEVYILQVVRSCSAQAYAVHLHSG